MKKSFDANVSRARPKLRLGALVSEAVETPVAQAAVEAIAEQIAREASPVIPSVVDTASANDLAQALKSRTAARAERLTAAQVLEQAIAAPVPVATPIESRHTVVNELPAEPTRTVAVAIAVEPRAEAAQASAYEPRAHAEPPPAVIEVQTAPLPSQQPVEAQPFERRERLKDRLRAVRENPRPEPLPDTVAEAGVLAVERISALQTELTKARALNLALTQDLEAARRQAERATEEARLRMDEAKRLASEMESRVTLLSELEGELEALESERNEALLALQESRQATDTHEREKQALHEALAAKNREVDESLAEEERLASELEAAQSAMSSLRRGADALKAERDTLARQVAELTTERTELLEARKALEAVHRALSSAVAR